MLQQLDNHWVRHLTDLEMLREGIGLRAIGQQKPIVAYQKEAYEMYQEMLGSVQTQIVRSLFLIPQQAHAPQGHPSRRGAALSGEQCDSRQRTNSGRRASQAGAHTRQLRAHETWAQ